MVTGVQTCALPICEKFEVQQGGTNYHKFTITKAGKTNLEFMSYAADLEYSLCDSKFKRIDGQSRINGSETSPIKASMYEYLSRERIIWLSHRIMAREEAVTSCVFLSVQAASRQQMEIPLISRRISRQAKAYLVS